MRIRFVLSSVVMFALVPFSAGAAQALPTAEELIARHEAASGGAEALDKHTSIKLIGTVEFTGGDLSGTIEILRGRANRYVQKMVLNRVGTMQKGFDSTVAWVIDPSGPALLTGVDADAVQVEANWYHAFLAPPGLRMARVDSSEFSGQPAWRLTYASELGLETLVYFSRATGLRMAETRASPAGETVSTESDYKDFGGVKFPTSVTNRTRAGSMVITIQSVEFDRVPDSSLALPAQIRALIKPH